MVGKARSSKSKSAGAGTGYPPWSRASLAPIVLLLGKQEVFASRALTALRRQAVAQSEAAGDMEPPEATEITAVDYEPGTLAQLLSPSLFGGAPLVIVRGLENASADLLADLAGYLQRCLEGQQPAARLLLWHAGGVRGKKVLDLVKKLAAGGSGGAGGAAAGSRGASGATNSAGSGEPVAVIYSCDELKRRDEKLRFLGSEGERLGRRLAPDAAAALVDALGNEFGELVAVSDQLLETAGDLQEALTLQDVQVYLQGRVETTGFDIADAAVAGNVGAALARLRHALGIGVEPVLIVTAMGMKVRQLLQLSQPPAPSLQTSGLLDDVKPVNDWVARQLRPVLSQWDDHNLGLALTAVAEADFAVKGGSRDAHYALEAMVLEVCRRATMSRRRR